MAEVDLCGPANSLAEAAAVTRARQGHRLRILAVTASGAGGANAVMGTGTASAEMIAACGATSVGVTAGLRGYSVKFTDEGLLSMKPDAVSYTHLTLPTKA